MGFIEVADLHKQFDPPHGVKAVDGLSFAMKKVRFTACWVLMVPARPPPSPCSPACYVPPAAMLGWETTQSPSRLLP